jgi:uncharacterized protein YjbI with pentapeptide repeats
MSERRKMQTIRDRDGAVMYEGEAVSLKAFVETLVGTGCSMARADLRRRDLSGLDLNSVDFSDALLDGADLRGMSAQGGLFTGASMRGVVAQGLLAERAQFQGVDLSPDTDVASRHYSLRDEESVPSHLEGARLTYSNFSGAVLDGAVFDQAAMSRTLLFHVRAAGASFRAARLFDAAFSFGTFVNCGFEDAGMTTTTQIDPAHLPDRTAWMTVANCRFDGAALDATVPAFSRDHRWTKTLRALAYTVSSAAIFAGMHQLHLGDEMFVDLLKNGTTLVLATTAVVIMKDMIAERARDFVEHHLSDVDRGLRGAFEKARRQGVNLKEMVVAAVRGPGLTAVTSALRQTRRAAQGRGFFSEFWHGERAGGTSVIFADRRHLAVALEALCAGEVRHRLQGDLVLIGRQPDPAMPSLVRYKVDGSTSMAWVSESGAKVGTADYDRDGNLMRSDAGVPAEMRIEGHIRGFEAGLLESHGLSLDYDPETHEVRAGQDGSILVMNRSNRRIGNPHGPSLIKPDGTAVTFRNGKAGSGREDEHGDVPPPTDESDFRSASPTAA